MKKSLILAALVLISAGCFAQKNPATKKAKSYINSETPDFTAARASIAEALEQEPTAETYYWAGMIGFKEVERENYNQMMGVGANVQVAGAAVEESYAYWLRADELAQVPVLNKKGVEVPTDPKMRAKLAKMMLEYYSHQDLLRYGVNLYESRDYEGAYKAFKMHIDIPELAMMQNDKLQKEMPRDTNYIKLKYNAALFAVQAELHPEAIELLDQLKDGDYDAVFVNQYLYQEYMAVKDTTHAVEALQYAIVRFPQEEWFIQNLVNYSIQAHQEEAAIAYLTTLIDRAPQETQYYVKRGIMYEMLDRFDDAMADFDKVIEMNPNLADAVAGKGRVYYNKAVKLNEAAALIQDNKEYKKALDEMNEVFRQSLPYFEKAHTLAPEKTSYLQTLKTLYYRFRSEPGMQEKYDATMEKLNNL